MNKQHCLQVPLMRSYCWRPLQGLYRRCADATAATTHFIELMHAHHQ